MVRSHTETHGLGRRRDPLRYNYYYYYYYTDPRTAATKRHRCCPRPRSLSDLNWGLVLCVLNVRLTDS